MNTIIDRTLETIAFGLIIAAGVAFWYVTPANAQTTYYTDSYGNSAGSASTYGDTTYYSDSRGNSLGSSTTSGYQYNPDVYRVPCSANVNCD